MRMASKSARSVVFVSVNDGLICSLYAKVTKIAKATKNADSESYPGWGLRALRDLRVLVMRRLLHLFQHGLAVAIRQRLRRALLRRNQLDVETERLQLADEHVERLRQPGRE